MNSFINIRNNFLVFFLFTAILLLGSSKETFGQSFSVTDSIVYLKKHTGFGVVHWYAELTNNSSSDIEMQWTAYFSKSFQKKWVVSWDDQSNYYQDVKDLDSGLFVLTKNTNSFKLPFGVAHKGIAGEGSVTFQFHPINQPTLSKTVTFIIEITEQATHIQESENGNGLVVYPNPIMDENVIHVEGVKNSSYTFRVINSNGKVINEGDIIEGMIQIPLFMTQGKYILEIENEGDIWTFPILKTGF